MATSATAQARYHESVRQLQQQYQAVPVGQPVRLAKRTSNAFRTRSGSPSALDVSEFSGVLAIDEERRTADVLGMTTYEQLVAATLPRGLMPLVVPELKTITIGGAVTGLGIESSSFRNGCPHESVLEMDVLVGDGRVVTVAPDGPHADLFFGFPNSYGTFGYALRLRIELEPVRPVVALRHSRFGETSQFFAALADVVSARVLDGEPVDFVDGVFFGPDEMYLTTGRFVDHAPYVSDYGGSQIYYRSLQQRTRDFLTVGDYLWRWDTDWFWCSRALGVQHPLVRPLLPRSAKRSDRYFSVVGFEQRHDLIGRLQGLLGRPEREVVVQDVEVPVDRAAQIIDTFTREVGISPVWVCPLRQRDESRTWELYVLDPATTYVNFGFWSSVERRAGERDGDRNRMIERLVADLGGRKSLYSTSFYDRDEFWATYNGPTYQVLKKEYDADGRLLDLYDKCVRAR